MRTNLICIFMASLISTAAMGTDFTKATAITYTSPEEGKGDCYCAKFENKRQTRAGTWCRPDGSILYYAINYDKDRRDKRLGEAKKNFSAVKREYKRQEALKASAENIR